ncbi:MAG: NUDIX hydrolase, partial [Candidatus Bipolaricaulota bacterium]
MPRVVVEGLCMRADRSLLLVKGSRGYTAGRWSLPGGFLRFGERPEEGMARELREELGVAGRVGRLLLSTARLGVRSRLHW